MNKTDENNLTFKMHFFISRLIIFCIITEIILVLTDILFSYKKIIPVEDIEDFLDLTGESTAGTIFSSLQMLFAGITLLIIYSLIKRGKNNRWKARGWLMIALFFIYMAADDGLFIHENLGSIIREISEARGYNQVIKVFEFYPSYSWQLLLGPFFAFMGLFIVIFLWKQLEGMKLRRYIFMGLVCLSIAVVMDFIEGMKVPTPLIYIKNITSWENYTLIHFWRLIEETLEMLGITSMWYVFLKYLYKILKGRKINVI